MKYAIVASTWASFSRTVAAGAIGSWLAFANCPTVFAADGPQAAAAAKEAAKALSDYAAGLARLGDHPRLFQTAPCGVLPSCLRCGNAGGAASPGTRRSRLGGRLG